MLVAFTIFLVACMLWAMDLSYTHYLYACTAIAKATAGDAPLFEGLDSEMNDYLLKLNTISPVLLLDLQ